MFPRQELIHLALVLQLLLVIIQFDGIQLVVGQTLSLLVPLFNNFLLVLGSLLVNQLHLFFLFLHPLLFRSDIILCLFQLPIHELPIFLIFVIIARFLSVDLRRQQVSQVLLVLKLLLGSLFLLQLVDLPVVVRDLVPVVVLPGLDIHSSAPSHGPELGPLPAESRFSLPLWGRLRYVMASDHYKNNKLYKIIIQILTYVSC